MNTSRNISNISSPLIKPPKLTFSQSNMTQSTSTIPTTTFVQLTTDINLLKFRLSAIKPYDGNPEGLNNFIFCCKKILQYYDTNTMSVPDKEILILHLKAKLLDRATLQLGTRNYDSFDDFFTDLRQSFSLGKNLNSYRSDIMNAYKKPTQTPLEFSYEVRKLLDLACDFAQSQNYQADELKTILRELEVISVEKVISYCPHDLTNYFFASQPSLLATVIFEIQRHMAFTQRLHKPSISVRPTPKFSSNLNYQNNFSTQFQPTPTFQPRPFHNQTPQRFQNNFTNQNRPSLPPKPQFIPRYPNNQQKTPSGQYANQNAFNNQYPKPRNDYATSRMQISQNYRTPIGNRPLNNYNGYNNNYKPARPNAPHPPTPMEINNHNYSQDEYYLEQNYDYFEPNSSQFYEPNFSQYYEPQDNFQYDTYEPKNDISEQNIQEANESTILQDENFSEEALNIQKP